MTLYLDSSALVKRYVAEPGSAIVDRAMVEESDWASSQITFVETMRALSSFTSGRRARSDWDGFNVVDVDQPICERGVELAGRHGLKTLDAIQLASGLMLATPDLTFATFDRRLHAAAKAEGFETLPAELS